MLVGLDFDNTIVGYDVLFHEVAHQKGLVPRDLVQSKMAVREYIKNQHKEELWTELQGEVYGLHMMKATANPGVFEFMQRMKQAGIPMVIVSHKTRYPYLGEKYDLHVAAMEWINHFIIDQGYMNQDDIFFELTKASKVARIGDLQCQYFVDDLPDILNFDSFPKETRKLLYDADNTHSDMAGVVRCNHWDVVSEHILTGNGLHG